MQKTLCAVVPEISINENWEFVDLLDKSGYVENIVLYSGMELKKSGKKSKPQPIITIHNQQFYNL